MKNTRLIQFLQTLSPSEFKGFGEFVISPAFNKNEKISMLFEQISRHYPQFENKDLTEERLFESIYKGVKFDYFKMKNLLSDLLGLGKDYLAFIQYRKDQNNKDLYLLNELAGRGLDLMFESAYKAAESRLNKSHVHDEHFLLQRFRLTSQIMNFHTPKRPNVNFHYHQELLDIIVDYSNLTKLKTYNIMLHERNQNNYDYSLTMFEQVMEFLKEQDHRKNPAIEIYYDIICLCVDKTDENFFRLKESHDRLKNKLGIVDDYMAFLHLDSYCATAYNIHGRTDLLRMQFELNKLYDMNNLPELGSILYPNFLNFVKIASRVEEFEYAEEYIEKYKNNLKSEKNNTVDFCCAYIAYRKGDHSKALSLLAKTSFSNYIIKLQVKLLQLQLNYELGYLDQVALLVDSFRHYLSREKLLLDVHREVIQVFLKIITDMSKLRTSADGARNSGHSLMFEIDNLKTNHFGIKLWLKEKASEL